jgi:hypothetical protein
MLAMHAQPPAPERWLRRRQPEPPNMSGLWGEVSVTSRIYRHFTSAVC